MKTTMTEEAQEARRQYMKEWRKKNADKVREQRARYWQHKAEQLAAARDQSQEGRSDER